MHETTTREQSSELRPRLAEILAATPDFVGMADADRKILYINPAGKRMLGIPADENVECTSIADYYPARGIAHVARVLPVVLRDGVWSGENVLLHRSGREIPVLQVVLAHKDAAGGVRFFSTIARDVSHQKEVEQRLRDVEAKIRSIAESAMDYIMLLDLEGRIEYINRTVPELTVEQVIGTSIYEYVPVKHRHTMEDCFRRVVTTKSPDQYQIEVPNPDGTVLCFEANVAPVMRDHQVVSLAVTSRDVTERIQTERKLRESERSLSKAQQIASTGSWRYDPATGTASGTAEMYRIISTEPDTVPDDVAEFVRRFVHPGDQLALRDALRRSSETGETPGMEFRLLRPDGELRYVRAEAETVRDDNGQLTRIVGTLQDVSSLKATERKLRESEERFRGIFENEPECVKLVDADGCLLDINPAGLAMIEVDSVDEVRGARFLDLVVPEYREAFVQATQEVLRGTPRQIQYEIIGVRGDRRWLDSHMVPIVSGRDANVLLAVTRDITAQRNADEQKRQLREELTHVARLSTLGEMVAGIAHEVNQPLHAIANFATACSRTLETGKIDQVERALNWTRKISEQANRVREIICRLRNFARKAKASHSIVDVNDLVRESIELVEFEARHRGVLIQCCLAEQPLFVLADRIQLQQVLVNLLRNAFDAVERVDEGDRQATVRTIRKDQVVEVICCDSGRGFPSHDTARIFDAFFTTKPNGMGMGLTICRTIIEDHAGSITAESANRGARFVVTLQRKESDVRAA